MSRFNPDRDVEQTYNAAALWLTQSLVNDHSVFEFERNLWTVSHLDELNEHVVENPKFDNRSFIDKLGEQLSAASKDCKLLMAEYLWLLYLFPSVLIKPQKKRENIAEIHSWSGEALEQEIPQLRDEVIGGVGSAGRAYNMRPDLEWEFLIPILCNFKHQNASRRKEIVSDPWGFSEWLTSFQNANEKRQIVHILPHLMFPDSFERISSGDQKIQVLIGLDGRTNQEIQEWSQSKIDKALLELRNRIEKERNTKIDFYQEEFKEQWNDCVTDPENINEAIQWDDLSLFSTAHDPSAFARIDRDHLLGIEGMQRPEIESLLDRAGEFADLPHGEALGHLKGVTVFNLFFENSTRTRVSFDLAARRIGASVVGVPLSASSIKKGESLMDTAVTLNAMHPDILVMRHHNSGAALLLSRFVDASVVNAGDGRHEHPTQALLDALTIRRRLGDITGLKIAICGDIANSRVARSNIHLLSALGAEIRLVSPPTLLPAGIRGMGVETHHDMADGVKGVDIVMLLRLQTERMQGTETPSQREYFHFFGLDAAKLAGAAPGALIMHPGPMNRGVEIDSALADDHERSLITTQVEMGVAVRMACLEAVAARRRSLGKAGAGGPRRRKGAA